MALRSGYKGFKKLLPGLKIIRPGALGIDNNELSKTFFPRNEQAVLGAKNLYYLENSDINNNLSGTHTFSDGEITVNCSNAQYSGSYIAQGKLRNKLSNYTNTPCIVSFKYKSSISCAGTIGIGGATETLPTEWTEKTIYVSDPSTISAINFYNKDETQTPIISVKDFMIRLATDPDSTYAPYAMTNRELTELKLDKLPVEVKGISVDALTDAGIFYCNGNMTGLPYGSIGLMIVFKSPVTTGVQQIYIPAGDVSKTYMRRYWENAWSNWYYYEGTQIQP